jgi:hypothetical protein
MGCAVCQRLETELKRVEDLHAKARKTRETNWHYVHRREYALLQSAESDARLALEIARAEMNRHKRNEHRLG